MANTINLDDNKPGHVIHWVEKGGAAEYGGLNDGDRLTAIDGKDVVDLSYEEVITILEKVRFKNSMTPSGSTELIAKLIGLTIKISGMSRCWRSWFDNSI